MAKVSVIIPTYQRAHFVGEAIRNAQGQTYQALEIIVVNDGSTDETAAVLAEFGEQIMVIHHKENRGVSAALNSGIRAATGKYIAFLDDDDIWLPYKLEKQVAYMEQHPDVELLGGNLFVFSQKRGLFPHTVFKDSVPVLISCSPFKKNMMYKCVAMIRRTCFDKVGLFDEEMFACEDYEMSSRVSEKYKVAFLKEPLVCYRRHDGGEQITGSYIGMLVNLLKMKEKAFLRNPTYQDLPEKELQTHFYEYYLRLARYYIGQGKGQAARQTLQRYYRIRGRRALTHTTLSLWARSWLSPAYVRLREPLRQRKKHRDEAEKARALAELEEQVSEHLRKLEKELKHKN